MLAGLGLQLLVAAVVAAVAQAQRVRLQPLVELATAGMVLNGLLDLVLITLVVVVADEMELAQEEQGELEVEVLVVAGRQTITPLAGLIQAAAAAELVDLGLFKLAKTVALGL
jgi:hypothetical protein